MSSRRHFRTIAAALGLLATVGFAQAAEPTAEEMQDLIADLRAQNISLQRSLLQANRAEKDATEQLAQVRLSLEALGKNLLDGGNDRLIQAAADLELARERNAELEAAAIRVISSILDYLRQAVVSDPDSRLRLETSLRELDSVLGFKHKPRPDVRTGSLQQARVVSIDQESGLIVLNVGENQNAKIGMTFDLFRARQCYGKAILADVRKAVSGAFIEYSDPSVESPRTGDLAVLKTE